MSSATCSGSAEQPANNSKDSSAEHMCSAVQPASLPGPPAFPHRATMSHGSQSHKAKLRGAVTGSKPIPRHRSDRAAVFNAFAFQEDSGWTSGSDHDVVLVPLCWRRHPPANAAHAADTERVEATPYRTLGHGPAEPAPRDYSTCRGGPYRYRK